MTEPVEQRQLKAELTAKVEQRHRDAAVALMRELFAGYEPLEADLKWASTVERGEDDTYPIVEAFATFERDLRPDDALRAKVQNWRDNLAITRGDPIMGDALHGPALDFVIEQLDGILARTALEGNAS